METTIIIARVLGIYFAVSGLFIITRKKTLALVLKDLFEHRSVAFLAGVMLLFGGGFLVFRGDTGADPLSIFVKVLSWLILLKGITYILIPEWLNTFAKRIPRSGLQIVGGILTILGIYLIFFI